MVAPSFTVYTAALFPLLLQADLFIAGDIRSREEGGGGLEHLAKIQLCSHFPNTCGPYAQVSPKKFPLPIQVQL